MYSVYSVRLGLVLVSYITSCMNVRAYFNINMFPPYPLQSCLYLYVNIVLQIRIEGFSDRCRVD